MSIKAVNATTQQLAKSLKKSMGEKPFAMVRAYTENPKVFKHDALSKKAITAELCDRFSATKKQRFINGELLSNYGLPANAKLKDLSREMVEKYLKTSSSDLRFEPNVFVLTKQAQIRSTQSFIQDLKALKKQTSGSVKKACKQLIKSFTNAVNK